MPKLLSRSKHEEFESNSALQIRDQKERREENTRKLEHLRNWFLQHCSYLPALFLPAALFLPVARSCFLRYALFAFVFSFFPFYPCTSLLILVFFCNFPYTEHLYKPQSVKTWNQSTHFTSCTSAIQRWAVVSPLLPFLLFFCFLFHFLGCQTPFDDDKSKDVRLNLPHP